MWKFFIHSPPKCFGIFFFSQFKIICYKTVPVVIYITVMLWFFFFHNSYVITVLGIAEFVYFIHMKSYNTLIMHNKTNKLTNKKERTLFFLISSRAGCKFNTVTKTL